MVKLSLCLTKHHAMETYLGNRGIASRPGRFTSREGSSGTHWIGGWVDARAVLYAVYCYGSFGYRFESWGLDWLRIGTSGELL